MNFVHIFIILFLNCCAFYSDQTNKYYKNDYFSLNVLSNKWVISNKDNTGVNLLLKHAEYQCKNCSEKKQRHRSVFASLNTTFANDRILGKYVNKSINEIKKDVEIMLNSYSNIVNYTVETKKLSNLECVTYKYLQSLGNPPSNHSLLDHNTNYAILTNSYICPYFNNNTPLIINLTFSQRFDESKGPLNLEEDIKIIIDGFQTI